MPGAITALPARAERYGLRRSAGWANLLKHFELGEGFAFILLTVPDQYGAEVCQEALAAWLRNHDQEIQEIPVGSIAALEELPDKLLAFRRAAKTGAVWVAAAVSDGSTEYPQWRKAWGQVCFRMNRIRDTIAGDLRCPLILVGAPWLREVLRDAAPDLWSIRQMVAEVAPETRKDSGEARQAESMPHAADSAFDPDFALQQAARVRGKPGREDLLAELLIRAAEGMTARQRFPEALVPLEEAVLVAKDPSRHAEALDALAGVEYRLNRFGPATSHVELALATRRDLAKANPEAYLPVVATTLNNLANLYSGTQRMKEAEEAYREALATYRDLAKANPEAYLPGVATTLNNLAVLYSATQRMKEAEEAYREALATRRDLAKANPEAYLPVVATTLNNLGLLYSATQRMKEAEETCSEAARILEPLWRAQPEVHGDQIAKIWGQHASMLAPERKAEAAELAGKALAAAYKAELRETIEGIIEGLSVD